MSVPWEITPEKVREAVRQVISVARPRKVILFGSAVRGETNIHSDLDILVVTKAEIDSPRRESVRIRRALRGIVMPMDILVVSEKRLEEVAEQPGLIYRKALRQGKVAYDARTEWQKGSPGRRCGEPTRLV